MKCRNSFCNGTLLKKNITRFAPLWIVYTVLLIAASTCNLQITKTVYPSQFFTSFDMLSHISGKEKWVGQCHQAGYDIHALYALLTALCCFGYLHKTRSAYMLHSLPISRSGMYVTSMLSGLLFAIVPQLFVTALNLVVMRILNADCAGLILTVCLEWLLQYLLFFGIAVFCMLLTGRQFMAILIYILLTVFAYVLKIMTCDLIDPILYGFSFSRQIQYTYTPDVVADPPVLAPFLYGLNQDCCSIWSFASAAAGVVLLVLSWLLYRSRAMEKSGEMVVHKGTKTVFRYMFAYLFMLCIGTGLFCAFKDDVFELRRNLPLGVLCLLIGAFVGFFGAEMILERTVRVFRRRKFLTFGILALVIAAAAFGMRYDVLHLQSRIPQPEEIASVQIADSSCYSRAEDALDDTLWCYYDIIELTEQEDIAAMCDVHQILLDNKEPFLTGPCDMGIWIRYHLKSGKTIDRVYEFSGADLRNMSQLVAFYYYRPNVQQHFYEKSGLPEAARIRASGYHVTALGGEITLNREEAAELYRYLLEDIRDGNVTLKHPFGSEGYYRRRAELDLYFTLPDEESEYSHYARIPLTAEKTLTYLLSLK